MWLVVTTFAAILATAFWYFLENTKKRYRLDVLTLMLWGASIMIFVDHCIGYITEGGEFLEISVDSTILGIVMVMFALIIWGIFLLVSDPMEKIKKVKLN